MRCRARAVSRVAALALSVLACALGAAACGSSTEAPAPAVRLVVVVSVDQLPPDLLDRYDSLFAGGFRRLRDSGFRFTQATHDFAWTRTAPGHATLATGVQPSKHGIVANDWWERRGDDWYEMYAVGDTASPLVLPGSHPSDGRSPANLAHTGLADWVRTAYPNARIVSISRKDRAAIPLAGTAAGHVYWIRSDGFEFTTSQFYRGSLPRWVKRFNRERMPEFRHPVWELHLTDEQAAFAHADSFPGEGDRGIATFPHVALNEVETASAEELNDWWIDSPFADEAVLALGMEAIRELELGRPGGLDYLALGFSSTDEIGHDFGPYSLEQLDNLVRLDRLLGTLLATLDAAVGAEAWVLALSSDHGVLPLPELRWQQGLPAFRPPRSELMIAWNLRETLEKTGDHEAEAQAGVIRQLEAFDWLEEVVTPERLAARLAAEPADTIAVLLQASAYPGRFVSELGPTRFPFLFAPGALIGYYIAGTDHGTPYWFDRHVPLMFAGAGIPAGSSDRRVSTVDFAPTLARLAGVPAPPDLDGRPIDFSGR